MSSRPRSNRRALLRRRLPMRYLLPSLLLVALLAMLMLRGYVHSEILADHRIQPPAATDHVPEKILEGGPVIDTRGGRETSMSVPEHRLVLTFDDGPDPEWTPKVLDVLKEHHAHGVFFVTGTMASRYPDLVKRMVDEGHEVGLHTFNHPDLSYHSKSRIDWELTQNQTALAGAAGIRTSLFRPPYSSFADAMDNKSWPVTKYIGSRGYITVVNNTDSEDWKRPGVDEIIRRATPKGGKGAIVLMHDSGGDRSQTVAALDRFLPQLQSQGYDFVNLTEALGAPSAHTPVHGLELAKGKAWIYAVDASDNVTDVLVVGLAVIGVLVFTRFGLMLLLSGAHARRVRRRGFSWGRPSPNRCRSWSRRSTRPSASRTRCVHSCRANTPSRSSSSTTARPTARPASSRICACQASGWSASTTRASRRRSTGAWPTPGAT